MHFFLILMNSLRLIHIFYQHLSTKIEYVVVVVGVSLKPNHFFISFQRQNQVLKLTS